MSLIKKMVDEHFEGMDVDCAITVALKILDKKCQMDEASQALFMQVYDAVSEKESRLFKHSLHETIAAARKIACLETLDEIHRQRLYAMEMIPKPTMKAFKAKVRNLLNTL